MDVPVRGDDLCGTPWRSSEDRFTWSGSGGHVRAFGFVAESGEEGERKGDDEDGGGEDGGVVA
jgi:hypothetical protein